MGDEDRLRVLFLSLEFSDTFSGNGVYAQSIVRNLVAQRSRVLVICGKPAGAPGIQKRQPVKLEKEAHLDFVEVRSCTVPVWFKLDRSSSWQEYGLGAAQFEPDVSDFQPDVILGVDWTSLLALESLIRADETRRIGRTPFVFMCFRVFSQGIFGPANADDERFYGEKEAQTLRQAARTVALSKADARALEALLHVDGINELDALRPPSVYVVAPPLRDEVRALASKLVPPVKIDFPPQRLQWEKWSSMMNVEDSSSRRAPSHVLRHPSQSRPSRIYVTCCCRISPEKQVMRFVEICERLAPFLKSRKLVPYLVGPATDPVYARRVYQRLKKAFPGDDCIIVSDFVAPDKLQAIFTRTALNIHPAASEPYGMTIAEAAAFGAPSLVDSGGQVGAVDLLPVADLCSWGCTMSDSRMAAAAARSALCSPLLEVIGSRAQITSLQWGSKEHAVAIRLLLEDVLKAAFRQHDKPLSPRPSVLARSQSAMETGGEGDPDWPWIDMIQWAMSDHDVGVVVKCDVAACKRVVNDLLALPPYGLASLLLQSRKSREPLSDDLMRWATFLLGRRGGSLGAARFRLVPSRLSEDAFWGVFFFVLKRGLAPTLPPLEAKGAPPALADAVAPPPLSKEAARPAVPSSLAAVIAPSPLDGVIKPLPSSLSNALAALEHVVQRDECARGIGALIAALPPGQVQASVLSLLHARGRVLLLTGFPCLQGGGATAQETDGPPGVATLAKALVACGKRVVVCIEEPNAVVMRACIAAVFPRAKALMLREQKAVTSIEAFGTSGQVVVESFPVVWTRACEARCEELVNELAAEGGHMVAIERAGPGTDGQCRTMKGRVMTSDVLAPLHVLFERRGQVGATGVGDGGNEVGMGSVVDAVRKSVPNGPSIACVVGVDHLVCCSVSNWGAYALAAGLALLGLDAGKFTKPSDAVHACLGDLGEVERIVQAACAVGARDGVNGHLHSVDGLPLSKSSEVVEALKAVVLNYGGGGGGGG